MIVFQLIRSGWSVGVLGWVWVGRRRSGPLPRRHPAASFRSAAQAVTAEGLPLPLMAATASVVRQADVAGTGCTRGRRRRPRPFGPCPVRASTWRCGTGSTGAAASRNTAARRPCRPAVRAARCPERPARGSAPPACPGSCRPPRAGATRARCGPGTQERSSGPVGPVAGGYRGWWTRTRTHW